MKILRWTTTTLGVVVVLIFLTGLALPATFRVERSATIAAPPEVIFAQVADLGRWPTWTVWSRARDPGVEITHHGPDSGVGSEARWQGERIGSRTVIITALQNHRRVAYDLHVQGFDGPAKGTIVLAKGADGTTQVTWTQEGGVGWNVLGRLLLPLMDGAMGPDLESGLARLRELSEGSAQGTEEGG